MTSTYTSAGITLDRVADILARLEALDVAQWGDSVNLSEDQLLGHWNSNVSLLLGEINEILQDIYDAGSVNNATGTRLANLVALVGLEVQDATYGTVTLTISHNKTSSVPAGTIYETATGIQWAIDTTTAVTGSGTTDMAATCTITGEHNAAAGEIDTVTTAVFGVTGVTNAAAATPGRAQETDAELKARHTIAVAETGQSSVATVYQALSEVSGISNVYLYENDTSATVISNGASVPAHNIHCSVVGGTAADIVEAIAENKGEGVPTFGSSSSTHLDTVTGQTRTIYYDVATATNLYCILDIVVTNSFPTNGDTLINTALVDYYDDFKIAQDMIYTANYEPIYGACNGFHVNKLWIGTTNPPTIADIVDVEFDYDELATLATGNITINHV